MVLDFITILDSFHATSFYRYITCLKLTTDDFGPWSTLYLLLSKILNIRWEIIDDFDFTITQSLSFISTLLPHVTKVRMKLEGWELIVNVVSRRLCNWEFLKGNDFLSWVYQLCSVKTPFSCFFLCLGYFRWLGLHTTGAKGWNRYC